MAFGDFHGFGNKLLQILGEEPDVADHSDAHTVLLQLGPVERDGK